MVTSIYDSESEEEEQYDNSYLIDNISGSVDEMEMEVSRRESTDGIRMTLQSELSSSNFRKINRYLSQN